MGFWSLLEVASMPVIQVLIISLGGAFMASDYCKLLTVEARNSMNKVVFVAFAPCLMFANLAKTVTLEDIVSWWFMPVNMGLTFLIGGILGWIVVKLLKPVPYLEGLVIAACSSGNMGNLPVILVPAICDDDKSPFGNRSVCRTVGLSYASFSMALGGFYIWTYTFRLIKGSAVMFKAIEESEKAALKPPNSDLESDHKSHLLDSPEGSNGLRKDFVKDEKGFWRKGLEFLHQILEELLAPPTVGAMIGFVFGAVVRLRNLIIGDNAPLRVIQDTAKILGDGTIPGMTIILGGNLVQGLRSSAIKPPVIAGIICVRYVILPAIGICVVKTAESLGLLPADPLFQYVLMLQFTLPPAMNIGTMTQLFNVGQDECSVLLLWTYLVAALALTIWSTIFLSLLS
ncbi:PREDICTED: protein PIN-LIKES 5-like [Tarenaya hassleriana]|uniref:protein PIN-LIKES 5-like n=1 Tax=Tarenaya hassleriana TaxID=28532 RepID=UPI00053C5B51|nr:PREDICTED: protein PIN-LIKES 5-like [Tarenaya hassleriana]